MQSKEEILWLLTRIKWIASHPNRRADCKQIFQGSYDVWNCEQDRIDAIEIPNQMLNEVRSLGLIENESKSENWVWRDLWSLTETGEKFLESL